jgi:hypothetical protein
MVIQHIIHASTARRPTHLLRQLSELQLNFVSTDSDNTDPRFTRTNFFGPARSPWFYTEMLTDSVNMDLRIAQTTFLARRVPKYTG